MLKNKQQYSFIYSQSVFLKFQNSEKGKKGGRDLIVSFSPITILVMIHMCEMSARSHGNAYIFYEVANSYEFLRILTTLLVQMYKFFAKSYVFFTSCQFV